MLLPQSSGLLNGGNPPRRPGCLVILQDARSLRPWFFFPFMSELAFVRYSLQRHCVHADVQKKTQRRRTAWSLRLIRAGANANILTYKWATCFVYLSLWFVSFSKAPPGGDTKPDLLSQTTHTLTTLGQCLAQLFSVGGGSLSQDPVFISLTLLHDGWVSRSSFRKWVAFSPDLQRVLQQLQPETC